MNLKASTARIANSLDYHYMILRLDDIVLDDTVVKISKKDIKY